MTTAPTKKPRQQHSKTGQPPYTGALAEKIALPAPRGWLLTSEQWRQQREEVYLKAFQEKLPLLFKHFDIAPGDWKTLALVLAQTHVPGLQAVTPVRRGPKQFWTIGLITTFVTEMQVEIDGPKRRTISDAAATLAKRLEWKTRLKAHAKPAEVLRHKYHELMNSKQDPDEFEKVVKQWQRNK